MKQTFSVRRTDRLTLFKPAAFEGFYALSPFVWKGASNYEMLLRLVNPSPDASRKVARIHHAESDDGLSFEMGGRASIPTGPSGEDRDGCEDPTVAILDDFWHVYYTGWNESERRGQLLYASGPNAAQLAKNGVAIPSQPSFENPKEATIACGDDGIWNLFFEYADEGASQIGLAKSNSVSGPWMIQKARVIEQRADRWDNWHLSPGPVFQIGDHNYMFYNGGTRAPNWRIGWVAFDARFESIVDRCADPIITPASPKDYETDIAFSASLVRSDDGLWLYFSVADQYMYRATVTWGMS